ncbi:MAG: hypothetical protein GY749_32095 [Desulfobacteraceae bacterium]|nr:hypothetical protein [Desulfobacteraceae bacterium]
MDELLKQLNSIDEAERIYAAQDIAETNDPGMAAYLIERLPVEESQAVKDAIVFALKTLPCSRIYTNLFELFSSPDPYLRNSTIDLFGSEGNDATDFLSSNMNHAEKTYS